MKQWLLLENHPALLQPDFLPSDWPEVAHLRVEHQRLLGIHRAEWKRCLEIAKRHEAEDAARSESLKASFLANGSPGKDDRATEDTRADELADAQLAAEAATDALVTFLKEALAEIEARAPEGAAALGSRRAEAGAKREEAQRLLAEAERQLDETRAFGHWLSRFTGDSALGYIPYGTLAAQAAEPVNA